MLQHFTERWAEGKAKAPSLLCENWRNRTPPVAKKESFIKLLTTSGQFDFWELQMRWSHHSRQWQVFVVGCNFSWWPKACSATCFPPHVSKYPMLLTMSNLSSWLLQLFAVRGTCTSFLWCWRICCAGTSAKQARKLARRVAHSSPRFSSLLSHHVIFLISFIEHNSGITTKWTGIWDTGVEFWIV